MKHLLKSFALLVLLLTGTARADCILTPNLSLCILPAPDLYDRPQMDALTNAVDLLATNLTATGLIKGILPAANFPALTGDVTTVAGGLATTIGASKVTNAMLAGSISLPDKIATFSSGNLAAQLTDETGTGLAVFGTAPVLIAPVLGTPTSGVATNLTGTAAGLTAGNVTTNANLTGHITSVGNAAVLGSFTSLQLLTALTNETGTGAAVFGTAPTLSTPVLGVASATSLATSAASPFLLTNGFLVTIALTSQTGGDSILTIPNVNAADDTFVFVTLAQTLSNKTFVAPALGTPASGVATNLTGTAAGLTAGNVTTNANLTGHVTSVGNAAVLGSFTSAQLATALTNETGSGLAVFDTSPTFITPTLGVASATSLATSAASPLLLTNGQLVTVALTSQTIGATTLTIPDFASVVDEFTFKTKSQTMSNKTFVAPALGTPASGVMTSVTGTAAGLTAGNVTTNANLTGEVTSTGNAALLGSFTSAALATALTNETGSGLAVFDTTPTLVTPVLGVATGTSLNVTASLIAQGNAGQGSANTTQAELSSNGTTAFLLSYNRGTSAYKALNLQGLNIDFSLSGTVKVQINSSGNLVIDALKSVTGVRYVCVNTTGVFTSQSAACVGT